MKKLLIFIPAILILFSCSYIRENKDLYSRLETTEYGSVSEEREKELKDDIRDLKEILEEKVETARALGSSYKLLGKLYLENEMYLLSLEQFEEAMKIYPENPILFYYAGLCSARYSKSSVDETLGYDYLHSAVKYYKKAIEFDEKYTRAMMALSVLYLYELDNPAEAAVLLNTLTYYESTNFEAQFLLANAYIQLGRIDNAISIYETIIKNSNNKTYNEKAEENKKELEDNLYDWN